MTLSIFHLFLFYFFFCPLFLCDPTKYLVVAGYRSHALQCTTLQVRRTSTCTALHLHELRTAVCTVTWIFTCNTWTKPASSLCVDNNRNRSQIFLESRLNHVTMFGWRDRREAAICLSTSVYMFQIISDGFSTLCLNTAFEVSWLRKILLREKYFWGRRIFIPQSHPLSSALLFPRPPGTMRTG